MKIKNSIKSIAMKFFSIIYLYRIFYKLKALILIVRMDKPRIRFEHEYTYALAFHKYLQDLGTGFRNNLYNKLVDNLDKESIAIINRTLDRHKAILHNNLLDQSFYFTHQDENEQKNCSKILLDKGKKYKKYNFSGLSPECFYGHSGLKWLPEKEKNRLKDGVCIDGGAGEGDTSIMLIDSMLAFEVHAYEIDVNSYKKLTRTVKIHNTDKIIPILKGLSDIDNVATVLKLKSSPVITKNGIGQKIVINKIDSLYKDNKVACIKLDVEGEEFNVLKGAENVIKRDKPILAISIYHNPTDFFLIKPWLELINKEYKFIVRQASPFALTNEIMLIAY